MSGPRRLSRLPVSRAPSLAWLSASLESNSTINKFRESETAPGCADIKGLAFVFIVWLFGYRLVYSIYFHRYSSISLKQKGSRTFLSGKGGVEASSKMEALRPPSMGMLDRLVSSTWLKPEVRQSSFVVPTFRITFTYFF